MRKRDIIRSAKALSAVFNPFYLPVMGLLVLFIFSYLKFLPWSYKLLILLLVYVLTILVPTRLIGYYQKYQGWNKQEMASKERRVIPYVISILCYFCCLYLLNMLHAPHVIGSVLAASLTIQVICAIINLKWKISTHTAAIGGITGAILAFAFLLGFNPTWWLCLTILLGGIVASCRMILRQHSLSQVVTGFLLGMVCAFFAILHF